MEGLEMGLDLSSWERCGFIVTKEKRTLIGLVRVNNGWMVPLDFPAVTYNKDEGVGIDRMKTDGLKLFRDMLVFWFDEPLPVRVPAVRFCHFRSDEGDYQSCIIWEIDLDLEDLTVENESLRPLLCVEDGQVLGVWGKDGVFWSDEDGILDTEVLVPEEVLWLLEQLDAA